MATSNKKKYNKNMNLGSKFSFGKYKGKLVKRVIEIDPTYVRWCIDNINWFHIGPQAKTYLENIEEDNSDPDLESAFSDICHF